MRSLDQGCELGHLILGLRIIRLGVRVPSGAQQIKAVTSRNAGHGLDWFPRCAAIFHMMGSGCSEGAPMSTCCFVGGPYRCVLTSADTRRTVRIMADLPPTGRTHVCPLWPVMWIFQSEGVARRPRTSPRPRSVFMRKQHRAYALIRPAASAGLQPGPTVETRRLPPVPTFAERGT
jgi:hypothetical protein